MNAGFWPRNVRERHRFGPRRRLEYEYCIKMDLKDIGQGVDYSSGSVQ
jgi:hypothetical protein